MNWLTRPLNSPLKRASSIALLLSLAWLIYVTVTRDYVCGYRHVWDDLTCAAEQWAEGLAGTRRARDFEALRLPALAVLISLSLSYAYDAGIGRVVRWVRGASARQ